jgi:hypothetical protein
MRRSATELGVPGNRVQIGEAGILETRPDPTASGSEVQDRSPGGDVLQEQLERSLLNAGRTV